MLPHRAVRQGRCAYHLNDKRGGIVVYHNIAPVGYWPMWSEVALCKTGEEFQKHGFDTDSDEAWVDIAYFFKDLEDETMGP